MAGEQFGAMAVDLVGAEADTSAMQIEGLAKAGGQGLGQAVDGYNQANFNQAIQDGEAYLNQMADELDIPQEKRNMIKFFSGNPEAVKRGAQFLMDSTKQQRSDKGIEWGIQQGRAVDEDIKNQSMAIFEDTSLTEEQKNAKIEGLKSGKNEMLSSKRLDAQGKDQLFGFDKVNPMAGGNNDDAYRFEKLALEKDRLQFFKDKFIKEFELKGDKYKRKGVQFAIKFIGVNKVAGAIANSKNLVSKLTSLNKNPDGTLNDAFNFKLFDIVNITDPALIGIAKKMNLKPKATLDKINQSRNAINQFAQNYIREMSGLAVTNAELKRLENSLGIGSSIGGDFAQFMDAFNNIIKAKKIEMRELETIAQRTDEEAFATLFPNDIDRPSNRFAQFTEESVTSMFKQINARIEGYDPSDIPDEVEEVDDAPLFTDGGLNLNNAGVLPDKVTTTGGVTVNTGLNESKKKIRKAGW
tara:strand:+ start:21039 stop:22442 length:1404 start_codon:yes stop_codon:yes gene_type:complete